MAPNLVNTFADNKKLFLVTKDDNGQYLHQVSFFHFFLFSGGKVLRRPNRPGSLKISHQANLHRLSSMSTMSNSEMSNLEDLVVTMENICRHLVNKNFSLTVISAISGLYTSLHHCGMQLDTMFKDQLDKLMVKIIDN